MISEEIQSLPKQVREFGLETRVFSKVGIKEPAMYWIRNLLPISVVGRRPATASLILKAKA